MTFPDMWVKLKTVSSLGWHRFQGVRYSFTQLWKMELYSTACQSLRSYKEALMSKKFLGCDLTSWSFGIVLVTILAISSFDFLLGQSGKYIGKDKKWHQGHYLFTVDWAHPESNIVDTEHSEIPHEHKCAHILALNDGNYAAQPNNRLIWSIPSFTVKDEVPFDWKVQTSSWNVEDYRVNGKQKIPINSSTKLRKRKKVHPNFYKRVWIYNINLEEEND